MWIAEDSEIAVSVMKNCQAGGRSYILHATSKETIVRAIGSKKLQEIYLTERYRGRPLLA
jgi:late competence protein required for DNA uptake (superfamily II DNA/RNA helicase)